tara:strand:+ start:122 stop:496 length:375 start_codon:yes stop_codon:yes gene_type:complete
VLVEQLFLILVDTLLEMLELMEVIHVFLLFLLQQLVVVKVDLAILDLYQLVIYQTVVHQVDQEVDKHVLILHVIALDLEQRIKVILVEYRHYHHPQDQEAVEVVELEVPVLDQAVPLDKLVVMV